ncbi:UNVERIFIED_CONTAM: hypothetical protein IGO34_35955, partial [Salmonella enterica subsp. enterica serovar Weltevreden]
VRKLDLEQLNEAKFEAQATLYRKSGHHYTAHYRYASFRNYLSGNNTLTDEQFLRYLELAMGDADKLMAGAALVDLFTRT